MKPNYNPVEPIIVPNNQSSFNVNPSTSFNASVQPNSSINSNRVPTPVVIPVIN